MRVAVYSRKVPKKDLPFVAELFNHINNLGWNIVLEEEFHRFLVEKCDFPDQFDTFSSCKDFHAGIDLGLSLGGDGTFLKMVSYIRDSGVPIMGINTGRLGFLANTGRDEFEAVLSKVNAKDYTYQKRSLLKVDTEDKIFGEDNFAFNELAVHKKDTSSMMMVETYLDEKYLNTYWADGLIVSTPTGSTAYSLSCGGPIITPGCAVHILTPIAPHNLNVRPVVVPDHMPIRLKVDGRDRKYLLTLDGVSIPVKNGTEVILTKAAYMINVIKFEENNFLDTIRKKMMWGIDGRNDG